MIKEGVKEGLQHIDECRIKSPSQFEMEINFKESVNALRASFYPGVKQLDANTVIYTGKDIYTLKALFALDVNFVRTRNMAKIVEVVARNSTLIQDLLKVWESSVRATHLFLSEDEINNIKKYVPEALLGVPHLVVAENENGNPIGFMGISGHMLEMLFISNDSRGKGTGKQLLRYGIENYSVSELAVNEQNPLAKGFYEHMGFTVYKRTELDEQGNPYPLLYMRKIMENQ